MGGEVEAWEVEGVDLALCMLVQPSSTSTGRTTTTTGQQGRHDDDKQTVGDAGRRSCSHYVHGTAVQNRLLACFALHNCFLLRNRADAILLARYTLLPTLIDSLEGIVNYSYS